MNTSRRSFPQQVEHGGHVARVIILLCFRLVLCILFAPAAWHALQRGDIMAALLSIGCAIGLGLLLAPID